MRHYAASTDVSSERSRLEIERTLTRYGATGFMYGWASHDAIIAFEMAERRIKFILPLPNKDEFNKTPGGRRRREGEALTAAWEQGCRSRWRALALCIKAKLEACASGITEFESEFMAQIVLPDGKTVAEHVRPSIAIAYDGGKVPPLMLGHAW